MATCKECVHSGICAIQLEPHYVLDRAQKLMRESNNVEHECLSFKDRSRFVELPYSLSEGDKLKYIFTDENNEIRIGDDWEVVTKICKDGFFVTGTINSDGTYRAGDCFYPWSAIGTEYFLTKEEAEQALAKQNQPDNTPQ